MTGRIIVGADESLRAVAAARWALSHAATTGGSVDVVTAWEQGVGSSSLPLSLGAAAGQGASVGLLGHHDLHEVLADEARAVARRCVRQAGGAASPVAVRTWALAGSPGSVLCDLAGPGDLLVAGHSGHGAIVSGILGSVAAHLVHHAPCPVVIVRDGRT